MQYGNKNKIATVPISIFTFKLNSKPLYIHNNIWIDSTAVALDILLYHISQYELNIRCSTYECINKSLSASNYDHFTGGNQSRDL